MHPDSRPERLDTWRTGAHSSRWFVNPEVRGFRWTQPYRTDAYVRLLRTHQDHILMDSARRAPLFDAIAGTIESAGGGFALPLVTWVCTLTRC